MSPPKGAVEWALPPRRDRSRVFALESWYELLKVLRLPVYVVPTLAFPALFYLFFGIVFAGGKSAGAVSLSTYLLATYGVFGVVGAALFGFGVGVAVERGQGWMQVKKASPMPPAAYFFAKMVVAHLFAAAILVELYLLAVGMGGVRLNPSEWVTLALVHLGGTAPFCALGLAVGYTAGPNSAPAIANLIYLPMAFASGLWIPLPALPPLLQQLAPLWPTYHFAQLSLHVIDAADGRPWVHAIALLGFTVLFLAIAFWAYRRDQDKTYG